MTSRDPKPTADDQKVIEQFRPFTTKVAEVNRLESPLNYVAAANALIQVKRAAKYFERRRKDITGPARAAAKAADKLFSGPESELAAAEDRIKALMSTYVDERVPAAQAEAMAALASGDKMAMVQSMSAVPAVPGIGLATEQTFEVVDMDAVPAEYLKVEINTRAVLQALREGRIVPGVRGFERTRVSVTVGE